MSDEPRRPPVDPAHPELGPSELTTAIYGESRLTDKERYLLNYVALRRVADDCGLTEQEAADILDGYAERGDPCRIVGDQREVAIVAGGVEVCRVERAWLRAMTTSGNGELN